MTTPATAGRVAHHTWSIDDPADALLVGRQPAGTPVRRLPDGHRVAELARRFGVDPEHLVDTDCPSTGTCATARSPSPARRPVRCPPTWPAPPGGGRRGSKAVAEAETELATIPAQNGEVCVETSRRVYQIRLAGQWVAEINADCEDLSTL